MVKLDERVNPDFHTSLASIPTEGEVLAPELAAMNLRVEEGEAGLWIVARVFRLVIEVGMLVPHLLNYAAGDQHKARRNIFHFEKMLFRLDRAVGQIIRPEDETVLLASGGVNARHELFAGLQHGCDGLRGPSQIGVDAQQMRTVRLPKRLYKPVALCNKQRASFNDLWCDLDALRLTEGVGVRQRQRIGNLDVATLRRRGDHDVRLHLHPLHVNVGRRIGYHRTG